MLNKTLIKGSESQEGLLESVTIMIINRFLLNMFIKK